MGFAEPAGHPAAGGLLPRHFTLTRGGARVEGRGANAIPCPTPLFSRPSPGGIFLLHFPCPCGYPRIALGRWTLSTIVVRWSPDFPLSGRESKALNLEFAFQTAIVQPTREGSLIIADTSDDSKAQAKYFTGRAQPRERQVEQTKPRSTCCWHRLWKGRTTGQRMRGQYRRANLR